METRSSLNRLLRPRSVAVVGGGIWCHSVIEQCLKIGFDGPVWPVHPTKKKSAGLPVFSHVADLPEAPDAVFVGVNRQTLLNVLPEFAAIGTGGAVCFASGFLETGDQKLHLQLLESSGDMALLGPNCYGFINYLDRCALWPDQHGGEAVESGVAIITQSSNIALNLTMQKRGLPIAYMVTAGNQAQSSLAQIGMELLNDNRVTALGCHIEGFGNLADFEALAKEAYTLGKPVIVLKVGRSDEARSASITHTASLTGKDTGAQAFIDRLGFARVETLPQFLESLKLVHIHGQLDGSRIASLSCSGGEAGLIADAGLNNQVTFPALGGVRKKRLGEILSNLVSLTNPLDYHTDIWRDPIALAEVFAAMCGPDIDLTMVILDFPRTDKCEDGDWVITIAAIKTAAAQSGRPFAVVASLPENLPEVYAKQLMRNNIVPLFGIDDAIVAICCSCHVLRKPASHPVLQSSSLSTSKTLNEYQAKKELEKFGVLVPECIRATDLKMVSTAAKNIGYPVVLKGEGFAHKSEVAAVVLNLHNEEAVVSATKKMAAESFLIEKQITGVVTELLVGITRDEAHGFLLTLAAGGIHTEMLKDSQTLLVPSTRKEIESALDSLKCVVLLNGFRGKPSANRRAIVDTILAVQQYVISDAEKIFEVEVNPLLCTSKRAVVADALIRKEN